MIKGSNCLQCIPFVAYASTSSHLPRISAVNRKCTTHNPASCLGSVEILVVKSFAACLVSSAWKWRTRWTRCFGPVTPAILHTLERKSMSHPGLVVWFCPSEFLLSEEITWWSSLCRSWFWFGWFWILWCGPSWFVRWTRWFWTRRFFCSGILRSGTRWTCCCYIVINWMKSV